MSYRSIRYLNKKIKKCIIKKNYGGVIDLLTKSNLLSKSKYFSFKIIFLNKFLHQQSLVNNNIFKSRSTNIKLRLNLKSDLLIKIEYLINNLKPQLECYTNIVIIEDKIYQRTKQKVYYETSEGVLKRLKIK